MPLVRPVHVAPDDVAFGTSAQLSVIVPSLGVAARPVGVVGGATGEAVVVAAPEVPPAPVAVTEML